MKNVTRKQHKSALVAAVMLAIASAGAAAQSLESIASVGVSNLDYNGTNNILALIYNTDPGGVAQSELATQSFTGLNGGGSSDSLSFAGGARAYIVAAGQRPGLHVEAHGTLLDTFYNVDNSPYFDATVEPPLIDEDGTPDNFYAMGQAIKTELLSYGGLNPNPYFARYTYYVHGRVQGDGFRNAYLVFQIDNNPVEFGVFEPNLPNGEFVGYYSTQRYPVGTGVSHEEKTRFVVLYEADTQSVPEGSNISGAFDFSETITLDHIDVVDANNNPVSGWTVTAASGLNYDLPIFRNDFDPQPDPATLVADAIAPNAVELCARLREVERKASQVQKNGPTTLQRSSLCDQPIGAISEIKFRQVGAGGAMVQE